MELSEVRCSSESEELYTINKTPSGNSSTRPKRLLWQNAVRHITEQRFIHEQGGAKGSPPEDDPRYDEQGARKQSAGRTSVGDRHNNGGTKVFPERASSDLGFLQIDCAPSNSDFFLNWGYTYRGVIFPTLRNSFKSRDLERLYQRYFLGQRRKSVVVMNILDVVTKITLLVLHLTLASSPMDPIKGMLLGFFTGVEVVICALVVVRKDTTSHSYLQYSGVVTWVAMATQILAAGLGYGLLGDGVGYVLFTLFATYSMLPLPLTWAILAGLATSALQIAVQLLVSPDTRLSTNQVVAQAVLFLCMNTAGVFISYLSDRAQRQAFLETRRCIEARLRLETENQRQSSQTSGLEGTRGPHPSWRTDGQPDGCFTANLCCFLMSCVSEEADRSADVVSVLQNRKEEHRPIQTQRKQLPTAKGSSAQHEAADLLHIDDTEFNSN
ncbi:unnamed protein product [Lota lota]